MMLTEYDEDFNNKTWYEDGVEDGRKEKRIGRCRKPFKRRRSP